MGWAKCSSGLCKERGTQQVGGGTGERRAQAGRGLGGEWTTGHRGEQGGGEAEDERWTGWAAGEKEKRKAGRGDLADACAGWECERGRGAGRRCRRESVVRDVRHSSGSSHDPGHFVQKGYEASRAPRGRGGVARLAATDHARGRDDRRGGRRAARAAEVDRLRAGASRRASVRAAWANGPLPARRHRAAASGRSAGVTAALRLRTRLPAVSGATLVS